MILLLIIFRLSIVDGKEVNQKTLSAKLFLKMKSDKPDNLDPLKKKELIRVKLGKFKVAEFPRIVVGMPSI